MENKEINQLLAAEMQLPLPIVEATVSLLDDGNTVPFIARYRKEATGEMDDQLLRSLSEKLVKLRLLEERRAEVRRLIAEQDKLTPELEKSIAAALSPAALEDLYRPFRPKRRTRGMMARERGLEPLAEAMRAPHRKRAEVLQRAATVLDPEQGLENVDDALAGAMDILAEDLSDDAKVRARLRSLFARRPA